MSDSRRVRPASFVVLSVLICACESPASLPVPPSSPSPVIPSPSPVPTQPATVGVSGVVFEYTPSGRRPLAEVPLVVTSSNRRLELTTDFNGRYWAPDLSMGLISVTLAEGTSYYAPCPSGGFVAQEKRLDVHVLSEATLTTVGVPEDMPREQWLAFSGMVYEVTAQDRQPVVGALVQLGTSMTLTNSAGRYLICPSPTETSAAPYQELTATRSGYRPARVSVEVGWDPPSGDTDIAMTRQ